MHKVPLAHVLSHIPILGVLPIFKLHLLVPPIIFDMVEYFQHGSSFINTLDINALTRTVTDKVIKCLRERGTSCPTPL